MALMDFLGGAEKLQPPGAQRYTKENLGLKPAFFVTLVSFGVCEFG